MLADSASSPLPALTSSPAQSIHSLPGNDTSFSDLESSDIENGSDESFRDPPYQPPTQVTFTTTWMPLKNKPFTNRSISTSSASNLLQNGYRPYVCILSHERQNMGCIIEKAHMIPQATKPNKVSSLRSIQFLH